MIRLSLIILFFIISTAANANDSVRDMFSGNQTLAKTFDFIPKNIVTNFSTNPAKPMSGGLAYEWTTENNVHIDFGVNVNAGAGHNGDMGMGPHIGIEWKF